MLQRHAAQSTEGCSHEGCEHGGTGSGSVRACTDDQWHSGCFVSLASCLSSETEVKLSRGFVLP